MGGFPSAVMQNAGRQPDPYETVGNALKLKQAMAMAPEQLKAAQLENQQRGQAVEQGQMDIDSQKAIHRAYVEANGDYDKAIPLAAQYGAKPDALMKLKQASLATQEQNLKLIQAKGDRAIYEANLMQGAHDAVTAAKPEDRGQVYQQALQGLQQAQVDVSHLPQQYPGDDAMKTFGAVLKGHTQGLEEAAKIAGIKKTEAETGKDTAQGVEAQASTAKLQAELNFYKAKGLAPGVPLDAQEAADWISKNPGKGPSDYMKYKASLVPQMNFNLNNQAPKGEGGQPSSIAKGIADGSIKWGDAVSARTPMAVKAALLQEVKGINPSFKSSDFDVEKKVQEAFTSGNYSQQLNSINRAREHMGTFLETAKALDGGDIKAFNRLGNAFSVEFGSDKVGNLNIAKQAFSAEVGKAFAGASVALADREELKHSIDNASSFSQLAGAAKTADKLLEGAQKALKQTYESGKQGRPNFGDQQGQSQANSSKVLSMSQIQQAAKDHGVSVEEATRQAQAAGYQIK